MCGFIIFPRILSHFVLNFNCRLLSINLPRLSFAVFVVFPAYFCRKSPVSPQVFTCDDIVHHSLIYRIALQDFLVYYFKYIFWFYMHCWESAVRYFRFCYLRNFAWEYLSFKLIQTLMICHCVKYSWTTLKWQIYLKNFSRDFPRPSNVHIHADFTSKKQIAIGFRCPRLSYCSFGRT